jgi:hypothetical protein
METKALLELICNLNEIRVIEKDQVQGDNPETMQLITKDIILNITKRNEVCLVSVSSISNSCEPKLLELKVVPITKL